MPLPSAYEQVLNVLHGYSADGASHSGPPPRFPGGEAPLHAAKIVQVLFETLDLAVPQELAHDRVRTALIVLVLSWLTATGLTTVQRLQKLAHQLSDPPDPPKVH